jgi:hypothetical protein
MFLFLRQLFYLSLFLIKKIIMKTLLIILSIFFLFSCSPKKDPKKLNKTFDSEQKETIKVIDSTKTEETANNVFVPKDGKYNCKMIDTEFPPESGANDTGVTVIAIVKGNRIVVVYDKTDLENIKKNDMLAEGFLLKHKVTGDWIIAQKQEDVYAEEVGGCSDGPIIIDLENGFYYFC